MSEELEKQEGQKTVVAFISGLLIGGLLVWVFSSSPEQVEAPEVMDDTDTQQEVTDTKTSNPSSEETTTTTSKPVTTGEGKIVVADQAAGDVVVIDSLTLPTEAGWVVVRELNEGVAGNVLGAARYSTEEGLIPESIELLRATTAGSMYQVVFFTNYGDKGFDLGEDNIIDGVVTTFSAN